MSISDTYYDILSLTTHDDQGTGKGEGSPSKDEIKAAYRRALLLHHPDKVHNHHHHHHHDALKDSLNHVHIPVVDPKYTVDEIVTAYQVLLDPAKRATYDENLKRGKRGTNADGQSGTHIGVEEFDLEDMAFHDTSTTWSRSCRCGNERGYILTEQDLERESLSGEIYVGCRGCSLFIKVLFAVEEHE